MLIDLGELDNNWNSDVIKVVTYLSQVVSRCTAVSRHEGQGLEGNLPVGNAFLVRETEAMTLNLGVFEGLGYSSTPNS